MTRKPDQPPADPMVGSGKAGRILGVAGSTVRRWGIARKLTVSRTLGGQFRYPEAEVRALAASLLVEAEPQVAA
jgi:predicted site-specific integrase-resolvase